MKILRQLLGLVCASVLLLGSGASFAEDAAAYLAKAHAQLDRGDRKAAVIELKNALQQDPASVEARVLLGEVYLQMGEAPSAEQEFRRLKDLHAAKTRWEPGLGEALLRQGRFSDLLAAIPQDDSQPSEHRRAVLVLRGRALVGADRLDEAQASFDAALAMAPEDPEALIGKARVEALRARLDAASGLVEQALAKAPDSVEGLLVRGEIRRRQGDVEGTIKDFTRLLELDPGHIQARIALAGIRFSQGDLQETLKLLKALPKQRGQLLVPAVLLRALVYAQQGRTAEATDQVQLILRAAPENTQAQLLYGVLSYSQGNLELADDMLTRASAKLPESAQLSKLIAAARLGTGKLDKAVQILEPAAQAHPDDAQLLALLGSAYLRQGDTDRGAELLGRAVEVAPDAAPLRTQLAVGLLMKGETGAAVTELQAAVKLDDNLVQAEVLLVFSQIRQKDYDKAIATAEGLEKRRPTDAVGYNLTGIALLAAGKSPEAEKRFRQALEVDPSFLVAELNLARVALNDKDPDRAEGHYKTVLEKRPNDRQALLGMLNIAEQRRDDQAFAHWLGEARERQPGVAAFGVIEVRYLLAKGEGLKALPLADALARKFPDDNDVLQELGRAQLAANQPGDAAATFRTLVERRPDSAETLVLAAGAEDQAGHPAEAKQLLERALVLDASYLPAQTALAKLALNQGDPERAIAIGQAIQSAHPTQPIGYEIAGAALGKKDKTPEAAAMYRKSFELLPSQRTALNLSSLYAKLDDTAEAETVLQSWLEHRPEDVEVLTRLATLYQVGNEPEKARVIYEKVREIAPDDAVAANNLAWLYFEMGDPRALEMAGKAYDLKPNHPEVLDTYGWVLVQKGGDATKAVNLLQQAMLNSPYDPEITYHTAFALYRAGREGDARKLLERLLAEQPKSKVTAQAQSLLDQLDDPR